LPHPIPSHFKRFSSLGRQSERILRREPNLQSPRQRNDSYSFSGNTRISRDGRLGASQPSQKELV